MLVRMGDWEKVREHFTQEEKDALNAAMTGETICPRGIVIDVNKVPAVAAKLRQLIKEAA